MGLTLSAVILLGFIDKGEFHPYQIQKNFTHCLCMFVYVCVCVLAYMHKIIEPMNGDLRQPWLSFLRGVYLAFWDTDTCLAQASSHRLVSPSLSLGLQMYPNALMDFPRELEIKLELLHFQSKNSTNWAVSPAPQPSLCRMSLLPVSSLLALRDHLLWPSAHSGTQVSLSLLAPYLLVSILSSGSSSRLQWPLPGVSKIQIPHSSLRVSIGVSSQFLFLLWDTYLLPHRDHPAL